MLPLQHDSGWVGVDEAGRGPLAGPVVAAAVWLPADFDIRGLGDSKQLSPSQRERLFERIVAGSQYGVATVGEHRIDTINILQATFEAMRVAVEGLALAQTFTIIVDGSHVPAGFPPSARAEPKADGRYAAVAAASIVAKVTRDRLMVEFGKTYPEYGFERHFGYGTPEHLEAIRRYGPCPIHRHSFAPIRVEEQLCLFDVGE